MRGEPSDNNEVERLRAGYLVVFIDDSGEPALDQAVQKARAALQSRDARAVRASYLTAAIRYLSLSSTDLLRKRLPTYFEALMEVGHAATAGRRYTEAALMYSRAFALLHEGHTGGALSSLRPRLGAQLAEIYERVGLGDSAKPIRQRFRIPSPDAPWQTTASAHGLARAQVRQDLDRYRRDPVLVAAVTALHFDYLLLPADDDARQSADE